MQTQPGDLILLYSDGIQDQPNSKGDEYGPARLSHVLPKLCDKTPEELVDALLADLDEFTADTVRFDDQTVVAMKVL